MRTALLGTLLSAPILSLAAPTQSRSGLLLLRPVNSDINDLASCATYHATVGAVDRARVYYLDSDCVTDTEGKQGGAFAVRGVGVDFNWPDLDFTATEQNGVTPEQSLSTLLWLHPVQFDTSLSSPTPPSPAGGSSGQIPFSPPAASLPTVSLDSYLEPSWLTALPARDEGFLAVLSPSPSLALRQLEYLTTHPSYAHYSLVTIPSTPIPLTDGRFPKVREDKVERVKKHLDHLRFQPAISRVLAELDGKKAEEAVRKDVRTLSGEDQSELDPEQKWVTRHSMSTGAPKAAEWIMREMASYSFICTPHYFLPEFTPMLECFYGNSASGSDGKGGHGASERVVLGAHYDSRGSFGYPTAPGADDDASGTSLLLSLARTLSQTSLRFSRHLTFAFFAGEEQGLLGSAYYAGKLREEERDVVMMLQVDMVGFRKEGEAMQLARPDLIGLAEAGWLIGNISEIYVPELVTGYTAACCSDHQTFVEQAFPATWIFERNGPIADPCYHNSCDLSARPGYSYEQILAHAKVALGWVMEVGGYGWL
ncbi:hypothetical protein JCM11641_007882 [Rhodosporidiobolus odoratus]